MSARAWWCATALLALLVPASAAAAAPGGAAPAPAAFPDLHLPDASGRPRALTEWAGRPLLLNYWATWCAPCLKEMPELDRFAGSQAETDGVRVVGIALDDPAAIGAYLARAPVRYPILVEAVEAGQAGSSGRFGNIHGVLPFSVLLDARGQVVRTKLGPLTAVELQAWTTALRP